MNVFNDRDWIKHLEKFANRNKNSNDAYIIKRIEEDKKLIKNAQKRLIKN